MTVTLLQSMGTDLDVVNSARISYGARSDEMGERDIGLISFLMRNGHSTPFEMVEFRFQVKTSIAVAREWFRHRTFSYNEISTRYKELGPDFYIPAPADVRSQVGKPGAYTFQPLPENEANHAIYLMEFAYARSYEMYQQLLADGVAKELARNVLPLGMLTEFIVKGNLRNWLHFLHLRTADNALLEIRREAVEIEKHIEKIVPVSYAAWVEYGRPG